MRKALIPLLFITGALISSGCATIVSGSTQTVSFTSNPEGATIELDGRTLGKAPLTVTLKRQSNQRIAASLAGYKTVTLPLETRQNSWFWGNILIGGFVGSTTDGVSGAVTEYSPSHYMITLPPEGTSNLEGKLLQTDEQKIREFVVVGYRQIVEDLRRGAGEYKDSLLNMLKVPNEQREEVAKRLRALSEAYTEIPEFASRVLDVANKNSPAQAAPPPTSSPTDIKETFASPTQFYDALCALPSADVLPNAARATPQQRDALTQYIVSNKGTGHVVGWRFDIASYLKPAEKECINVYLRAYTAYRPN